MLNVLNIFFKAGYVQFSNATERNVKMLLLIYSPRKKTFIGLIPNDQVFILIEFIYYILKIINKI